MASAGGDDKASHFFRQPGKKCRVCTDFKSWTKTQAASSSVSTGKKDALSMLSVDMVEVFHMHVPCMLQALANL